MAGSPAARPRSVPQGDLVARLLTALQGQPELAARIKQAMAQATICTPWESSPGEAGRMRRNCAKFTDIVVLVQKRPDNTWFFLPCKKPTPGPSQREGHFASAADAEAAADDCLRGFGMILSHSSNDEPTA